jgi:dihydroorotate dehydrogenase electron transfer subunit
MKQRSAQSSRIFTAVVRQHRIIRPRYPLLTLELDRAGSDAFASVKPGQFVEIDAGPLSLPQDKDIPTELLDAAKRNIMLRRPFSFSAVRHNGNRTEIDISYHVIGPSTVRLTTLIPGDSLNLIGPLGNGFRIDESRPITVLIAGGMGSPPIQHLAAYLKSQYPQMRVTAFIGARSLDEIPFDIGTDAEGGIVFPAFSSVGVPHAMTTDDGSLGVKGFVTQLVEKLLVPGPFDTDKAILYACGPEPMLAAVSRLAAKIGVPCQISMERMMACGIGLCQSCAIKTRDPQAEEGWSYRLCCKDGPVLDGKDVIFD